MTRNPLLIFIGLLTAVLPTTLLFVGVNMLFFVPLVVGLGSVVVGCLRISAAKKRTVTGVGVFLCLAAATCPFALTAYANRSGKPIRVVLPEGYRGRFSIVKDRAKGRGLVFENGAWVFEIPPDGELVVNDDHPFYVWHKIRFMYSDGHPARVTPLETTAGSIRTGPTSSRSSTDYDGTIHRWEVVESP